MKKVLFVTTNYYLNKIYRLIILKLEEKCVVDHLTNRKDVARHMKRFQITTKMAETKTSNHDLLKKYEVDVGNLCIREIKVYKRDVKYLSQQVIKYLGALEELFEQNNYDLVVNADHTLLSFVVELFCHKNDVEVIHKSGMGVSHNKMVWDDTLSFNNWPRVHKEMTHKQRCSVKRYISDFKQQKRLIGLSPINPDVSRAKKFFGYAFRHYLTSSRKDFMSPITLLQRWGAMPFKRRMVKKHYESVDGKPYIYFPLQIWDDIAVLRGGNFYQYKIIQEVSSLIKQYGMKLAVKEHPSMVGLTPMSWVKKMLRKENVVFINPEQSSHELIKNSKAVITISSTVGFETILLDKPLIVLQDTFYSEVEGVLKSDREGLMNSIHEVISNPPTYTGVDTFLRNVLLSEHDCYFFDPGMGLNTEDDNITKIVRSIRGYL